MTQRKHFTEQEAKLDSRRQMAREQKGLRPKPNKGQIAENAGKIMVSRTGAMYRVLETGSWKRLSDAEVQMVLEKERLESAQKQAKESDDAS